MQNYCIVQFLGGLNLLRRSSRKISLTMKLLFILIVCSFGLAYASDGYAQKTSITLKANDCTIEEVLHKIELESGFGFFVNSKNLDLKRKVSVSVSNKNIFQVLEQVFKGVGIEYKVLDNKIVLAAKEKDVAQQRKERLIAGTVKDKNGEPLIGVSIREKSSGEGTITDMDGNYKLSTSSANPVLVFSYVGYQSKEVPVKGNVANVVLEDATQELNEVVVTALGIKRSEKALSYNVQQLSGDELTTVKDANFISSLNGKVAGVNINSSNTTGGASRVVMRGVKSITSSNLALYVIDGVPMYNMMNGGGGGIYDQQGTDGAADINPEDIESISMLTGPSAAALYGNAAAAGVVLITTKKGSADKTSVTVSNNTTFSKVSMMPEMQSKYGNLPNSLDSWGPIVNSDYDPRDFFQTGANVINSFALSTGNKKNQAYLSASTTNTTNILPNSGYNRYNFTVRNTTSFLKDKMTLDAGASYILQNDKNMMSQGYYYNPLPGLYRFPRSENFDDVRMFERYNSGMDLMEQYWPYGGTSSGLANPYWIQNRQLRENKKTRYMINASLKYQLFDWLDVVGRVKIDNYDNRSTYKAYASTGTLVSGDRGTYSDTSTQSKNTYADAIATLNKSFNDWSVNVNLGVSLSDSRYEMIGYEGGLKLINFFAVHNIDFNKAWKAKQSGWHDQTRAIFANAEIGWKSMIYLTATGRNDWDSRLAFSDYKSFFYPSIGLSAILTSMFNAPDWLTYLKVRGSYTEVGAPVSRSGLTPGTVTTPIVGGALDPTGIYPFTDFKAERTKSYEFGLSLKLWNKLSAEVTYYHSNTYNQTFLGDLPEFTGYKQIYLQAGNVENRGWEASLSYSDQFKFGLGISSTLTFSRNINEIKEMVENYHTDLMDEPINIPEVLKDGGRVILKEGGSIHDIYANTFLKKDHLGYVEVKSDGTFGMEKGEPVYLGKTSPDFNMGWSNMLTYKGFGLGFQINGRFGGVVTSSTEALLDRYGVSKRSAEAREAGGVLLKGQGLVDAKSYYQMTGTGNYETSGYYVYSATNIRLQELTFSYTMPNKWFGNVLKDVTVSFIANNPWMLYCEAPFDPELTPSTSTYGQGNDYFMQPSVRSFGFGIKFKL